MRIFYAVDSTPNPAIRSRVWRANFYDTLISMGHEVVELDYDLTMTFRSLDPSRPGDADFISQNRPRLGAAVLDQVQSAHSARRIDLFFSYFYDACVSPEVIDAIRRLGILTVNWFCNASYQLHLVSQLAPHYDWCLVPERFRLEDYTALGARPIYCQEAANPHFYKPCDGEFEYDVAFAGQCYGTRPEIVRSLRRAGFDVRVWGTHWESQLRAHSQNPLRRLLASREGLPRKAVGGVLSDAGLIELCSRARINLGFATVGGTDIQPPITQVRLRDFEVPMCGGFYLTEHSDELAEFFIPGVEIETWRTRDELEEKCRYYLAHEDERKRVAAAGRTRAMREHTWEVRFNEAFRTMGLA